MVKVHNHDDDVGCIKSAFNTVTSKHKQNSNNIAPKSALQEREKKNSEHMRYTNNYPY